MTDSIENAIRQEFLLEADELLENCEAAFLELEQNPGNRGILDQIFRLAHTVKGSGLAAGFDGLSAFAHKFEALLDAIRSDKVELRAEVIDLLLRSNDQLSRYVSALHSDHNYVADCAELEAELEAMMLGSQQAGPPQASHPQPLANAQLETRAETDKAIAEDIRKVNREASSPLAFDNIKVLIVDDDVEHLDLIDYALEDLNLDVLKADSAQQALGIYDEVHPHLIITDLKMPEMNGITFATEVKKRMRFTPIIFCSGFAGRSDLAEFIALGAVGFVEKPYDPDHLRMIAEQALHTSITRDCVIKLARLAYQSYRLSSRIVTAASGGSKENLSTLKALEKTLDQVSEYSRFIVNPSAVFQLNRDKKKGAA